MTTSTVTRFAIVISAIWAGSRPAMAQHRVGGGGHPAAGGHPVGHMPHARNDGMGHVPDHIQRQVQQQMLHEQQLYQQHVQQMQQQAHQQYQQDLQRFHHWLDANGGAAWNRPGAAASRLPNNPAAFDHWAATQKQRKAQGKSYDPMYDQYRAFVGSMQSHRSRQGQSQPGKGQADQSQTGPSPSTARVNREE